MARDISRRKYVEGIGMASVAGLAGCIGGNGGSQGETRTIRVTMGPGGFQGIVVDYLTNRTSILEDRITGAGDYDIVVQPSWEGATLFASGGPDFSTVGPLEAAKLASERDLQLSVNAKVAPNYICWYVQNGGEYDPSNTGSVQATVDKLYEDGARHGQVGWGLGHINAEQYILQELFGKEFGPDTDMSLEVVNTNFSTIPQMIVEGELDSGANYFLASETQAQEEPGMTPLWSDNDIISENDLGVNALNGWTTTQQFANDHAPALEAFLEAWQEGMTWLFEDPMGIVMDNEDYWEQINASNEQQARWAVEWGMLGEHATSNPVVYEDISMSDSWISSSEKFVNAVADLGQVTPDWQDYLEYNPVL